MLFKQFFGMSILLIIRFYTALHIFAYILNILYEGIQCFLFFSKKNLQIYLVCFSIYAGIFVIVASPESLFLSRWTLSISMNTSYIPEKTFVSSVIDFHSHLFSHVGITAKLRVIPIPIPMGAGMEIPIPTADRNADFCGFD